MTHKWIPLSTMTIAIGIGLAGCGKSSQATNTPANVMQLVQTGAGSIKSTNKSNGAMKANNPNIYNSNTANAQSVEKEDISKVAFMPSGYLPIDGSTSTETSGVTIGGNHDTEHAITSQGHGKSNGANNDSSNSGSTAEDIFNSNPGNGTSNKSDKSGSLNGGGTSSSISKAAQDSSADNAVRNSAAKQLQKDAQTKH